jgi:hypothetical protein
MRRPFRIPPGGLTFVTVLLAVLTAPLQPLAEVGVAAQAAACDLLAVAVAGVASAG